MQSPRSQRRSPQSPTSRNPRPGSKGSKGSAASSQSAHIRECVCGRGMACVGMTQAFRMLGDPRCYYVELPRYRKDPPAYKYAFRNNLRAAYLRHLSKQNPDSFDMKEFDSPKRRYVALHHFHPTVVRAFYENPLTAAQKHRVPVSITEHELRQLNLPAYDEDRILSMTGKPTGGYYFVPDYPHKQAHDDLKALIKAERKARDFMSKLHRVARERRLGKTAEENSSRMERSVTGEADTAPVSSTVSADVAISKSSQPEDQAPTAPSSVATSAAGADKDADCNSLDETDAVVKPQESQVVARAVTSDADLEVEISDEVAASFDDIWNETPSSVASDTHRESRRNLVDTDGHEKESLSIPLRENNEDINDDDCTPLAKKWTAGDGEVVEGANNSDRKVLPDRSSSTPFDRPTGYITEDEDKELPEPAEEAMQEIQALPIDKTSQSGPEIADVSADERPDNEMQRKSPVKESTTENEASIIRKEGLSNAEGPVEQDSKEHCAEAAGKQGVEGQDSALKITRKLGGETPNLEGSAAEDSISEVMQAIMGHAIVGSAGHLPETAVEGLRPSGETGSINVDGEQIHRDGAAAEGTPDENIDFFPTNAGLHEVSVEVEAKPAVEIPIEDTTEDISAEGNEENRSEHPSGSQVGASKYLEAEGQTDQLPTAEASQALDVAHTQAAAYEEVIPPIADTAEMIDGEEDKPATTQMSQEVALDQDLNLAEPSETVQPHEDSAMGLTADELDANVAPSSKEQSAEGEVPTLGTHVNIPDSRGGQGSLGAQSKALDGSITTVNVKENKVDRVDDCSTDVASQGFGTSATHQPLTISRQDDAVVATPAVDSHDVLETTDNQSVELESMRTTVQGTVADKSDVATAASVPGTPTGMAVTTESEVNLSASSHLDDGYDSSPSLGVDGTIFEDSATQADAPAKTVSFTASQDEEEADGPKTPSSHGPFTAGTITLNHQLPGSDPTLRIQVHNDLIAWESKRRSNLSALLETTRDKWKNARGVLRDGVEELQVAERLVSGFSKAGKLFADALIAMYDDKFLDNQGNTVTNSFIQNRLMNKRRSTEYSIEQANASAGQGQTGQSSLLNSVVESQQSLAKIFRESAQHVEAEVMVEATELRAEIQSNASELEALGESILGEMKRSEMEVKKIWDVFDAMVTGDLMEYSVHGSMHGSYHGQGSSHSYGGSSLHGFLTPRGENEPPVVSSVHSPMVKTTFKQLGGVEDGWLVEMYYRAAVQYQRSVFDVAENEFKNLYKQIVKLEGKRQRRLQELMLAFVPKQRRLVLGLPEHLNGMLEDLVGLRIDEESLQSLIDNSILDRSRTHLRSSFQHKSSIMNRSRLQNKEETEIQDIESEFGSPFESSMIRESKLVELKPGGLGGIVNTSWKAVLSVITSDGNMHLFELPPSGAAALTTKEAFQSLYPNVKFENSSSWVHGRKADIVRSLTPCQTLYLGKCNITISNMRKRQFDILEDFAGNSAMTAGSRLLNAANAQLQKCTLRLPSASDTSEWVGILEKTKKEFAGRFNPAPKQNSKRRPGLFRLNK